jgi:hypothetical protein
MEPVFGRMLRTALPMNQALFHGLGPLGGYRFRRDGGDD